MTLASRTAPLEGQHVDLVPIDLSMAADLAAAAAVDRSTYQWALVPDSEPAMTAHLEWLLADRDAGKIVPFAHRARSTGRFVGCTRYLELRWFRGRPDPDEVEIGGTWIGAEHQRSALNTEAKLLMLTHAFETWNVWRVAIATDERNERSRAAIARLGATFEGILRNHRASWAADDAGTPRNTAMFSITEGEWPAVKQRLADRLGTAT